MSEKTYTGGCHCGAVRFEVDLDLGAATCCFATVIVKPGAFRLLAGGDSLTVYRRDARPLHHPFCKVCGVHAFGYGTLEEMGGAYTTVSLNCLEIDLAELRDQLRARGANSAFSWAFGAPPASASKSPVSAML